MYCKFGRIDLASFSFGDIEKAVNVFDEMLDRDVISYTALIDGFIKRGQFDVDLEWFQETQLANVEPDPVTIVFVLSVCANLGALGLGLWVHRFVLKQDMRANVRVNNSLIDMYSRCGLLTLHLKYLRACLSEIMSNMIIVGFALNGNPYEALEYFHLMQEDGFEPDGVSLTGTLSACSHTGMVDEGLKLFEMMKTVYRISPRIEHYGCIVDLYSRAGMFEDALNTIESMPMTLNEVVLGSLLAACRTAADIELAEKLMTYICKVNPDGDSSYVLLSNLFAAEGKWYSASSVRRKMTDRIGDYGRKQESAQLNLTV